MSSLARRRIVKDVRMLKEWSLEDGRAGMLYADDIMTCHCIIKGPSDTIWECGVFHVILEFTEEYPTKPPKVRFISQMFHPNVYANTGNVCLDILQRTWSPLLGLDGILLSLQILLGDPNPSDPANQEAALLFQNDPVEYDRRVIECVENSWAQPILDRSSKPK